MQPILIIDVLLKYSKPEPRVKPKSKKLFDFYENNKPLITKSKRSKKYLKRFNPIINSKKYFELLFTNEKI